MLLSVYKYVCTFSRGRQAMWLKAVTMPETGPGLRSSHMSMKKNSRVLRHMHVSGEMCSFYVLLLFETNRICNFLYFQIS